MKLGILVNTDRNLDVVVGIVNAALGKGHEVAIFAMDDGTRLLERGSCTALCLRPGVKISYCEHSAEKTGARTGGLDPAVIGGSQYDNASMAHAADKMIVL